MSEEAEVGKRVGFPKTCRRCVEMGGFIKDIFYFQIHTENKFLSLSGSLEMALLMEAPLWRPMSPSEKSPVPAYYSENKEAAFKWTTGLGKCALWRQTAFTS